MKVLVTGATGFLGARIAHSLHKQGVQLKATGRNRQKGQALKDQGLEFVTADLTDKEAVKHLLADCDTVIHSAALSSPWGKYDAFFAANVQATEFLVEAALQRGCRRFVHISTPALYFNQASRLNVSEDADLVAPLNHYIATKRLAEDVVDVAFKSSLPAVTLRPRAIYGPGDTSILPRLLTKLKAGRLPVIGDGQNLIDLSYVDNVVDAALLALEAPTHVLGKKYNITNGESIRLWDKIFEICKELNYKEPSRNLNTQTALRLASFLEGIYSSLPFLGEPPLTRYTVGLVAHSMTLDISAAKRDLAYKPKVSTDEGFARFLESWIRD